MTQTDVKWNIIFISGVSEQIWMKKKMKRKKIPIHKKKSSFFSSHSFIDSLSSFLASFTEKIDNVKSFCEWETK